MTVDFFIADPISGEQQNGYTTRAYSVSCSLKTPDAANMRSPYGNTLSLEFVWLVTCVLLGSAMKKSTVTDSAGWRLQWYKTPKIRGGAYELLINYFIFELHSMHAIQFCCQECTASCCHDFNTLRGRNSSSASFSRRNLEVGGSPRRHNNSSWSPAHLYIVQ